MKETSQEAAVRLRKNSDDKWARRKARWTTFKNVKQSNITPPPLEIASSK